MLLTARDQQILEAVHTHGFLTTDLIELAFFPATGEARATPSSCAYARIALLWAWGYVQRVEIPVPRSFHGRRPFVYALGRRGVAVVEQQAATAATVRTRRLDRLHPLFLDHDLKAAALWANLVSLLRVTKATGFAWTPERDLRARRLRVDDPDHPRRKLPFLPDGMFEITYADSSVQTALVEIDMGSLTLARFAAKVRAFERFLQLGLFEHYFGRPSFEVLVLAPSQRRLENLVAVARSQLAESRWNDYSFATCEVLDPREFAEAGWLTPSGQVLELLWNTAWAEETGS